MARRSTLELKAEFHRLYDILDQIIASNLWGFGEMKSYLISREEMLTFVDAKKATWSDLISGLEQAVNDTSQGLIEIRYENPSQANAFFVEYRRATGRGYFEDAKPPKRACKAILAKGEISEDTEYYLLNGWIDGPERDGLSRSEQQKINALIGAYEEQLNKT